VSLKNVSWAIKRGVWLFDGDNEDVGSNGRFDELRGGIGGGSGGIESSCLAEGELLWLWLAKRESPSSLVKLLVGL